MTAIKLGTNSTIEFNGENYTIKQITESCGDLTLSAIQTHKKKPFNLELALNGWPVVNRIGTPVTLVGVCKEDIVFPVAAWTQGDTQMESYTLDGKFLTGGRPLPRPLSCLISQHIHLQQ